jgi:hypothetical protein
MIMLGTVIVTQGQQISWLASDSNKQILIGKTCILEDELVIPLHIYDINNHTRTSSILKFNTNNSSVKEFNVIAHSSDSVDVIEHCVLFQDHLWAFGRSFNKSNQSQDLLIRQYDTSFALMWDTVLVDTLYSFEYFQDIDFGDSTFFLVSQSDPSPSVGKIWTIDDGRVTQRFTIPVDTFSISFWRNLFVDANTGTITVKQDLGYRLIIDADSFSLDTATYMSYHDFFASPFITGLDSNLYLEIFAHKKPGTQFPNVEWQTVICTTNNYGQVINEYVLDPTVAGTEVYYQNSTETLNQDTLISCVIQSDEFLNFGYATPHSSVIYPFETNITIYAYSPQGSVHWSSSFNIDGFIYPIALHLTSSNELILIGQMVYVDNWGTGQPLPNRPFIVKLSKEGQILQRSQRDLHSTSQLTCYPNPNDGIFHINLRKEQLTQSPLSIEIFDLFGKKVKELNETAHNESIKIDISDLRGSLYLISVYDKDNIYGTIKILKQ